MMDVQSAGAFAGLRLYLFGRFRIEWGEEPVRLPTRQTKLLLAYLALHPVSHSRDKLASLIWPDVRDASGRASLRNALSALRREIDPDLLLSDRKTVQLNPDFPIRTDAVELREQAQRFLQASEADTDAVDLNRYSDDLLVDFYDDWVLNERDEFRRLCLETLLELTRRMRSQCRYDRAIEFAERILATDPANEPAHQHLMFCRVTSGDRSAALKQYEACRDTLRDELDAEPSSATKKLYEWIRQAPSEKPPIEASITNLPIPANRFVGRKHETAVVRSQLSSSRLVTLTGAGGSGKTRLAIQVATDLLDAFHDGVWWVELADVADPEIPPHAVAKALGVPEVPRQPTEDTLVRFLRTRELLLVLDNCEHLVATCARLVERLISQCRRLVVMSTSREVLGIPGEQVIPVPTLSVPDPEQTLSTSRLLEFEAVQLFVGRATAINPDFTLTAANAADVARICSRLDGLPLAIELAAARINVLSVEQIAARLDDAFHLLTGGSRTALPRHRTLSAAIDWSFDLLSEEEQVLFRRLSVFAGGWTLPAAEAVCAGDGLADENIVDRLSLLVEKSLVEVQSRGGERRFGMLQTIRRYSENRLQEAGELDAMRTRHLHYFLHLIETADPHLGFMLPEDAMELWLDRLEPEQENLRAAGDWSLQRQELTEPGLRLLSLQHAFWFARGHFSEGRDWITRLLERDVEVPMATRAQALLTAGFMACWQGDFAGGKQPLEEALELLRTLGDDSGVAFALHGLGFVALGEGDAARGLSLFENSLRIAKEADDAWITSFALHFLGIGLAFEGELDRASSCFVEGNEVIRRVGGHKQGLAFSLFHLGRIARLQGDDLTAWSRHREGMRLFREIGDRRGIGYSLAGFAVLAAGEGDQERAARLSGAVRSLKALLGSFLEAPLEMEYDRELSAVRNVLGEEAFDAAAAEGQNMTIEEAIGYAVNS